MARISVRKLKQQASLALRGGDFAEALAIYERLEKLEPDSPLWPQRRADTYRELGSWREEFAALQRALELAIDATEVIQAIALCKQILDLDPSHTRTQEQLHLLYSEPVPAAPAAPPPPDAWGRLHGTDAAPLEEVRLTDELPGAVLHPASNSDRNGISEILLDDPEPTQDAASDPAHGAARPEEIAASQLREQLRLTPLFGSLDGASLRRLIERVRLVRLAEGENLFRQGEPADCLYVVAEGAVVPIAEDEQRKKLAVLEAGSFFGEIGLVTNQPRNATIQALVSSKLLAIDRSTVQELIREDRKVLRVLVRFLRDRLIDRLVRTSPFFAAFPSAKRATVAKLFRFLEASDGSVLIEQGHHASDLFAIVAGQARVIHSGPDGEKTLATLGPGDLFGEISLLQGEPPMASVLASGKCWLVALPEQRLLRLLDNNPELHQVVTELVETRSRDSRASLTGLRGEANP
ncbi:MAG: cyclic nucleotide-binding domain-containing protein [Deltaproteobacteria bacterium]|nr:cyclic nucleotide-binding domain-containing protein [Deltaproteobacteria bacterium]